MPRPGDQKWDTVRKGGPIHILEYRRNSGTFRWEAKCGLWGTDGYDTIDSKDHGRGTLRCLTCMRMFP